MLELCPLLHILFEEDDEEKISDEVQNTLAMAHIYDVPVFPNKEELTEELAYYHRKLLKDGFTAPDEKGERIRLKLTHAPGAEIEDLEHLQNIKLTKPIPLLYLL